jgi:copper chaperone CopZ
MSHGSIRFTLALTAALVAGGAALADGVPPTTPPPAPPKLETVYLEWTALKADQAAGVVTAVKALGGVKTFEWRVVSKEAAVVREEGKAADADLLAAAGVPGAPAARIPATGATLTFQTTLHCSSCVKKVRTALRQMAGVKEVVVPADLKTVYIVWDTRTAKREQFTKALADIGYPVQPQS